MKKDKIFLIFAVITTFAAASCARREPPVIAEERSPATVTPINEPDRGSSFQPAPAAPAPYAAAPQAQSRRPVAPTPAPAPRRETTAPPRRDYDAPPAPIAEIPREVRRPAQATRITIPADTIFAVRVGESLSSEKNQNGDSWSGVLAEPVTVNGLVVADRGARVDGRVTNVDRAGRVKGVARMTVALTGFTAADGQSVDIHSSSFTAVGKDETKKDAAKVGIASGIGAAIGAIAGKGKGAAIGAGAGAAAGTGVVLATRGGPAAIGNEALIRFRISEPVTITERLR